MMIGAELFRQGPRPAAMTVASFVNWIATFVIALGFEPLAVKSLPNAKLKPVQVLLAWLVRLYIHICLFLQKITGKYTFLIFLVLMIGFWVFIYFLVPETKNKTFEEVTIQKSYRISST